MPTFKIDGIEITAAPGTTVLQAALANGIEIPHYCYHPALTIAGSCRMCLVEIDNSPKLVLSCATEVKDGMEVRTQTDQVKDARRSMLEFFLINHPLDCPICDKAGECLLQDYTFKYGSSHSRMVEEKRVRPTKDLGGNILLYRNRCVLCTRCVRFFEDVVGDPHLIVENRGYHSDISIFPGRGLTHKMSGNVVEICPVGCLIDKDFLFHARVWNLIRTKSICAGCSSGCNIFIEHKENKVFRIRSRENAEVNKEWICDDGRYSYHACQDLARLAAPRAKDGAELTGETALQTIAAHLNQLSAENRLDEAAICGSAYATVEENWLLRRLFAGEIGIKNIFLNAPDPDGQDVVYRSGFTIRADKSPNRRGAAMVLGTDQALWSMACKQARFKTLFLIDGDLKTELTEEQKALLSPSTCWWSGMWLQENWPGWPASPCPWRTIRNRRVPLSMRRAACSGFMPRSNRRQGLSPHGAPCSSWLRYWKSRWALVSAADVLNDLASRLPAFAGVSYFKLSDVGIQLS